MKNYHIIALPRCGTKSVYNLIFDRQRLEQEQTVIKTSPTAKSGTKLGEFLHSRNNVVSMYPITVKAPSAINSTRLKIRETFDPTQYQFFDYDYDQATDELLWKSTSVRKEYTKEYFYSLVTMVEQFKKPWIIKTFPGSLVNNKFYQTSAADVHKMLLRLNKVSTPIILKRDFTNWIISLYFSNLHGKYTPQQISAEYLESLSVPRVIPKSFIKFQSNQYHLFNSFISSIFPTEPVYDVKTIFKDTTGFLSEIGLPPINSNVEYSKLDYKKVILNYDEIVPTSLINPYHI
jgi:hypothetical protein